MSSPLPPTFYCRWDTLRHGALPFGRIAKTDPKPTGVGVERAAAGVPTLLVAYDAGRVVAYAASK